MVLVMVLVMAAAGFSSEGGGWRVAMSGCIPGGEAVHCSLLVGSTQVSTMTYLKPLLHAQILSGCAVEVALL